MKKIIFIIIIIISFMFYINVNATSYTVRITDIEGVNVRNGAGTDYSVIGAFNYNATVNLVSTNKTSGSGCSNGWYNVQYGSTTGYICSDLTSSITTIDTSQNVPNPTSNYYTTSKWNTRINENYATVKVSPTFNSSSIERIYLGTDVKILNGPTTPNASCSTGWYYISYYNNKTGYVCARLVDKYSEITAYDEQYFQTLRNAGFPESYLPYLTYIHKKHPNWNFVAHKTNLDFQNVVNSETGKNYIQYTSSGLIISSYVKSPNPVESGTWYVASSPVVAFFTDPRNYLNDKNIFAFETLSYIPQTHTSSVVKDIFGSSYLSSDEYVNYYMNAAKTYNISPVHLAVRSVSEGMTDPSYDAVSGTSTLTYNGNSLTGVYNYFNIGAFEDGITSSSVARGLAVAKGLVPYGIIGAPWDTREKAILYGAEWIAKNYVAAGQDTAFYQKFNVSPYSQAPIFTNQYMTNILAPSTEALSSYDAYPLDAGYTFTIPVYNNMPEYATSHPPVGDTNNFLNDIKINNEIISGFDKDVISYTKYISSDTTSVNITASAQASTATITGIGKINTTNDTTEVKIEVSSEIGTVKTYTITLIKLPKEVEENNNTIEKVLDNIDIRYQDEYITGLPITTTVTTLKNMIEEKNASFEVKVLDKNNKEKTGTLATGNKLQIKSSAETKTYIIVIKGDTNGDGKINLSDLIRVQNYIKGKLTVSDEYKAAFDNNYDGKINLSDLIRVQNHIKGRLVLK